MALSLGDRLRQVVGGSVPRVAGDATTDTSRNSERIERSLHRAGALDGQRLANMLAGQWIECGDGAAVVVDRYYTPDRRHGRERIGTVVDALEAGANALDVLRRAWPGRNEAAYTSKLCFLDVETTGLAGGAGTQAFLVGCAILEDGGLRVRQFLLPGFEHERALLGLVAEWTTSQGTLVTFNGRTFDVPLIETRYLLHRLKFPLTEMPHLDMLHPARRLWKQRPTIAGPPLDEDSCTLSVLERHLSGYHRIGDVPGFEIPSRYFRFIRSGDAYPLEAVLEHNRIDLISLAIVTARALTLIQHGPAGASHPRECLGLGRLYEKSGARDEAEACYAQAASLAARIGREPEVHAEALRRLALCRRRAGRMPEAAAAWQQLVSLPGCPSVVRREAREALAIHHEHRSRNLEAARYFVLDVLAENHSAHWRARAEHRLQRIERKLAGATPQLLPI
jgi:uncharacterized protein YprB with RNaseH-like and TPR domain